MVVTFYRAADGTSPVAAYMVALDGKERARLADAFWRIQEGGLVAANTRQIDGELWEVKVSAQRAFYVMLTGAEMIVLHAYKKQGQKAPVTEIETARTRMKDVLSK